jgi:hypothetical protein
MWGATGEHVQIPTSFDIFRESADIISPTDLCVGGFRGLKLARGQSSAALAFRLSYLNSFPILLLLLPLVLMLYYSNSHVIKLYVINQAYSLADNQKDSFSATSSRKFRPVAWGLCPPAVQVCPPARLEGGGGAGAG